MTKTPAPSALTEAGAAAAVTKETALDSWAGTSDEQNRLFFQARNLAIEALCLQLENRFLRGGLDVHAEWRESSHPGVSLNLKLINPKKGQSWDEVVYRVSLTRKSIAAPSHLSDCYYAYAYVSATPWPRQPALAVKFMEMLEELGNSGQLAKMVKRVNYPFDHTKYSVF